MIDPRKERMLKFEILLEMILSRLKTLRNRLKSDKRTFKIRLLILSSTFVMLICNLTTLMLLFMGKKVDMKFCYLVSLIAIGFTYFVFYNFITTKIFNTDRSTEYVLDEVKPFLYEIFKYLGFYSHKYIQYDNEIDEINRIHNIINEMIVRSMFGLSFDDLKADELYLEKHSEENFYKMYYESKAELIRIYNDTREVLDRTKTVTEASKSILSELYLAIIVFDNDELLRIIKEKYKKGLISMESLIDAGIFETPFEKAKNYILS